MKTFLYVMSYLREEMQHEGLFIGRRHSKNDKKFIRMALRQLI